MRRRRRARVVLLDPARPGALRACRALARLDALRLLTFRDSPGLAGGLAVLHDDRPARAPVADLVAALPLGPLVAWPLRLGPLERASRALLGAAVSPRAARFFGWRAARPRRQPSPSPLARRASRALVLGRELLAAALLAAAVNQALVELPCFASRLHVAQPEPLYSLARRLRLMQGWAVFAPDAPKRDETLVVDAVTVDGRHVDPLRDGATPDLEFASAAPYRHFWAQYTSRMLLPSSTPYREAMTAYLLRLPERTGRAGDAIVAGTVYAVSLDIPAVGAAERTGYERRKLYSFGAEADAEATDAAPP